MIPSGSRSPGRGLLALLAAACLAGACQQVDTAALAGRPVAGAAVTVHLIESPETVGVFRPAVATVQPGQTVAWLNASGNYHTVTFETAGVPSSGGLAPGRTFEVAFDRPGTYRYRCRYHPGMVGEVRVGGPATSPRTG